MINLLDFNVFKEVRDKVNNDLLSLFNELVKKSINVFRVKAKIKSNVIRKDVEFDLFRFVLFFRIDFLLSLSRIRYHSIKIKERDAFSFIAHIFKISIKTIVKDKSLTIDLIYKEFAFFHSDHEILL